MRLAASLHMCLSFPPPRERSLIAWRVLRFPCGGVLEASPQAKGLFYLLKYLQRAALARVSKPAVTQPKALRSVFAWMVRSLPLSVPLSLPPASPPAWQTLFASPPYQRRRRSRLLTSLLFSYRLSLLGLINKISRVAEPPSTSCSECQLISTAL